MVTSALASDEKREREREREIERWLLTQVPSRLRPRYPSQIPVKSKFLEDIPSSQPYAAAGPVLGEACCCFVDVDVDVWVF